MQTNWTCQLQSSSATRYILDRASHTYEHAKNDASVHREEQFLKVLS